MKKSEDAALLIKVCGLREAGNIEAVAGLRPDFIGFVFHPASPRHAGATLRPELLRALPPDIRKVGVFVDETPAQILATVASFGLDAAQLHGQEPPAECADLRRAGVLVIKAFPVGETVDWAAVQPYEGHCDYYLFDTKGAAPGGNGTAFDWELLRGYPLATPYLLAGGLGPEHAAALAELHLPGLAGVDLNSRFEMAPGRKDPIQLAEAIVILRHSRGGRSVDLAA